MRLFAGFLLCNECNGEVVMHKTFVNIKAEQLIPACEKWIEGRRACPDCRSHIKALRKVDLRRNND